MSGKYRTGLTISKTRWSTPRIASGLHCHSFASISTQSLLTTILSMRGGELADLEPSCVWSLAFEVSVLAAGPTKRQQSRDVWHGDGHGEFTAVAAA